MSVQEEVHVVVKPAVQKRRARLFTIEPVVFLMFCIQGGFVSLRTLYIEHRLAVRYNYTLPTNEDNATCVINVTKDHKQAQIESETAIWVGYMKGVSVFLPLFVSLVYGAASDFIGRKPIFVVSATGTLVASGLFLSVVYFDLPLVLLVVGEGVLGICGDSVVFLSTTYAHIADLYEDKSRSFRIFLIELLVYVGFGVSQIVLTSILSATNSNYSIAYLVIFVTAILSFLYITIPGILLESVDRRPFSRGVLRDLVAKIYRLFKNNTNGRRLRILLLILNMIFYELIYQAVYNVITIYGLGPPFCWSETFVGLYGVLVNVAPALASIVALRVLGLCVSEYWLIYLGFLSGIGLLVTVSLAKTTPILAYVASGIGLLRVLPSPLLKFLMAQEVDNDEEGSLFGAAAVLTSIGNVISPILLNGIYASTVKTGHPTVTFYVAAGILVIPMIINGFLHVSQRQPGYQPLGAIDENKDADSVSTRE